MKAAKSGTAEELISPKAGMDAAVQFWIILFLSIFFMMLTSFLFRLKKPLITHRSIGDWIYCHRMTNRDMNASEG